jgi:hypothetical protein
VLGSGRRAGIVIPGMMWRLVCFCQSGDGIPLPLLPPEPHLWCVCINPPPPGSFPNVVPNHVCMGTGMCVRKTG